MTLKKSLLLAVVILAATYGVLAWRYWSNPPVLSRNFAAELNAPIEKFPADQRAWPHYREAILELETDLPDAGAWIDFRAVMDDPVMVRHLHHNEAALARARRAGHLPSFGFFISDAVSPEDARLDDSSKPAAVVPRLPKRPAKPSENPDLMTVNYPPSQKLRRLAIALQADAALSARNADGERATEDLIALMQMANHCREIPLVAHHLICLSRFDEALFTWGWLMEHHPEAFNEDRLIRLEKQAAAVAQGDLRARFDKDRFTFYDVVQRSYTDTGDGGGNFCVFATAAYFSGEKRLTIRDGLLAPVATFWFPSRRRIVDRYDQMFDLAEREMAKPLWEADFDDHETLVKSYNNDRERLLFLFGMMPEETHRTAENQIQKRDAILAASVLLRYRLKVGNWPRELEALVPDYLPQLPLDRRNGKPLGYTLTKDGPRLYSVGADGDDDQGRAAISSEADYAFDPASRRVELKRQPHFWRAVDASDGDLILWPVSEESPE